jgi:hypothetical protein
MVDDSTASVSQGDGRDRARGNDLVVNVCVSAMPFSDAGATSRVHRA